MRILYPLVFTYAIFSAYSIQAMPLDGLLFIDPITKAHSVASIEGGYDFTNDTVDYSPNKSDGGYLAPVDRQRYEGSHIAGKLNLNPYVTVDGMLWRRKIVSLRDSYDLTSYQAAIQYTLPTEWREHRFAIRAGLWSNTSSILEKNSYTRYQDYLFTSASLHDPEDQQAQLNLIVSRPFFPGFSGSFFTGVGLSRVNFGWLEGEIKSKEGCRYHFQLIDDVGEIDQLGLCGSVTRLKMRLPTDEAIKNNLGSNPATELSYNATFWQIGGNLLWQRGRWQTHTGYYYQQFDRGSLDERIRELGLTSHTSSHTIQTRIEYLLGKQLGIFLRGEYMSNRLLNMIPFTYNSYTADKFGKSGLLFSTGLRLTL
jgi:hypothetical protein